MIDKKNRPIILRMFSRCVRDAADNAWRQVPIRSGVCNASTHRNGQLVELQHMLIYTADKGRPLVTGPGHAAGGLPSRRRETPGPQAATRQV